MTLDHSKQVQDLFVQHLNGSANGIAVLDAEDRFLFYNQSFITMFAFEGISMIGKPYDDLMARAFNLRLIAECGKTTLEAWLEVVHARHRTQEVWNYEMEWTDKRWLLLTKQVYQQGMMVMVCADITRHKQTELALRAAHAELERLAMTDELTGISNRRHFLAQMEREYERAKRYQHPASLVMFDLDHFKRVNDSYGHPAGDLVLKHFADSLAAHARDQDALGRLGGEEFALLLPETSAAGAMSLLERVRTELANASLEFVAPGFSYTFSAGVAELSIPPGFDRRHWIQAADQALYQAKAYGRNRSVIYRDG
ncbi:GGDEF domain-containing protein [Chromobacterium subtsugae]|uniref:GGDEF domain-containing protein n=1 Tax=Chromobacterium subtsugae TaxID=251747 RepID=UPI0006412691|nr:sensor domain-containing diguanylate cyclase [Chromobacterium subtsugae]